MDTQDPRRVGHFSRRDFIKTSASMTASAALLASGNYAHAQGTGRSVSVLSAAAGAARRAAGDCANAAPGVEIVVLGDLFQDRVNGAKARLAKDLGDKFKVTDDRVFTGFDAYKKVIGSGVDLVILATPPGFRPTHFRAAVEAGKHVSWKSRSRWTRKVSAP